MRAISARSESSQALAYAPCRFFQWAFCMTSATIVSGAVAERLQLGGYCIFCFIMTSFVYPVVVAWTWSCRGWLNYVGAGYMDFAGSGIVHLCGGGHGGVATHFRALSRLRTDIS